MPKIEVRTRYLGGATSRINQVVTRRILPLRDLTTDQRVLPGQFHEGYPVHKGYPAVPVGQDGKRKLR